MIKFGIVGAGRRGLDHLNVLKSFEEVSVQAVCESDEKRLLEVSSKYKLTGYSKIEDMLQKEDLDAVIISTPVQFHVPQALQCIKMGVNVMMEKPISLDVNEIKNLLNAVRSSNVIVAIGFQLRYNNLTKVVVDNIDESTLSMLAGRWYWTIPPIPWIRLRNQAGGQVVEQAVHLLDLFRYFAGEVEKVYAEYTEKGRNAEEDKKNNFDNWASYSVTLRFKNGTIGNLYTTYSLYPEVFKSFPNECLAYIDIVCREKLIRYCNDKEVIVFKRNEETKIVGSTQNSIFEMYKSFIKAIKENNKYLLPTHYEDAYKSALLSLAANESAKSGKPVNPETLIN
ncbi:MAG: Gfo/Idh/MocA family oxidoreductase [Candidatus Brockarchaeota archaeon]|nr:Gfo/Idh/MocA family oxidoreductase [Candidatus Brockarchaeota archaeon]MBO3768265.1 Gfo/Idh/MocA family oxidoreductase [Candidatus Brockarchaeota archaeon]